MSIKDIRNPHVRKAIVILAVIPTVILLIVVATAIAVITEMEDFAQALPQAWRGNDANGRAVRRSR
jgi:amino acid permease